jgi:hypothetical protein
LISDFLPFLFISVTKIFSNKCPNNFLICIVSKEPISSFIYSGRHGKIEIEENKYAISPHPGIFCNFEPNSILNNRLSIDIRNNSSNEENFLDSFNGPNRFNLFIKLIAISNPLIVGSNGHFPQIGLTIQILKLRLINQLIIR